MAGEIPLSAPELLKIEAKFGFHCRQLLGKFMQLTNWTRLDLLTATSRVAQYQSSPGLIHFKALQRMVLYLWSHIDVGLTYGRCFPILTPNDTITPSVASINPVVHLECASFLCKINYKGYPVA
jgi:hypothetical protein